MLSKSENRLMLSKTITQLGITAPFPCNRCSSSSKFCVHMKGHPKCAECTHCGRPCVLMSLNSLNCAHKRLESQLGEVEAEHTAQLEVLQQLNSKILRLHKTIRQNKSKAIQKANCVAVELDSDNDEIKDENNSSDMQQLIDSMPPSFWNSILAPPQNVEVFSHSS